MKFHFSTLGTEQFISQVRGESWDSKKLSAWLNNGLQAVAATNDSDPRVQYFPPLIFRVDSSTVGELCTALHEACKADSGFDTLLKKTLQNSFDSQTFETREQIKLARNLWYVYAGIGDADKIVPTARATITLLSSIAFTQETKELSIVICSAVSSTRISTQDTIVFFKDLHNPDNSAMGRGIFWQTPYLSSIIDAKLGAVDLSLRPEVWSSIKEEYGLELTSLLDPETAAGRAMIRSCVRQIYGVSDDRSVDGIPTDEEGLKAFLLRPSQYPGNKHEGSSASPG